MQVRLVDVGGRCVEVHVRRSKRVRGHRAVVAPGRPPEIVVRPTATRRDVDSAIAYHRPWLERQLARLPEARLGLDRLRLTEEAGRREARARVMLIAQSEAAALGVRHGRIVVRDQRAAGARARRRGRCPSAGDSSSRPTTSSTTWSSTRSAISSSTTTGRRSGSRPATASRVRRREAVARGPRLGVARLRPAAYAVGVTDRWATFDCYGTLIDWNGGIRASLARVFGEARAGELLRRYHELEPGLERSEPTRRYREVLTEAMRRLGARGGRRREPRPNRCLLGAVPRGARGARGGAFARLEPRDPVEWDRVADRGVGSEARRALRRDRGGRPDRVVKPALRHWEEFLARTGAARDARCTSARASSTTSRRRRRSASNGVDQPARRESARRGAARARAARSCTADGGAR